MSVALIAVPQALAYAALAGLPAEVGLAAAALPLVIAAPFVASAHLQTGPVALTALMTAGALDGVAGIGADKRVALAGLLALMVGVVRLGLGLLRLGRIAWLLSEPVLVGFTAGAATLIVASQVPDLVAVDVGDRGIIGGLGHVASSLVDIGWSAVAFAALGAAIMLGARRAGPRVPAVLLAVVATTALSAGLDWSGPTLGTISGGVGVGLDLPWSDVPSLAVAALVIAVIGFAEPAAIARGYAIEDREPWDADREMRGQGVANVAAGLVGGMPVGGSWSRSALGRHAGASTRWAGACAGIAVLALTPLTPLLGALPSAVLAAIIVVSVIGLIRPGRIVDILRGSPAQGVVAIGTFAATVASAPRVDRGVIAGVVLAIGVHLWRELRVHIDATVDGAEIRLSPSGVLWFATIPQLERRIRDQLAETIQLDLVIIDLSAVGRLDFSGAAAMSRLLDDLVATGLQVCVVNVPPGAARAAGIHLGAHHRNG